MQWIFLPWLSCWWRSLPLWPHCHTKCPHQGDWLTLQCHSFSGHKIIHRSLSDTSIYEGRLWVGCPLVNVRISIYWTQNQFKDFCIHYMQLILTFTNSLIPTFGIGGTTQWALLFVVDLDLVSKTVYFFLNNLEALHRVIFRKIKSLADLSSVLTLCIA